MSLNMEESIVRQLEDMKKNLAFWEGRKRGTKDVKLRDKCGREIFKEKYRIAQTTEALVAYRVKHEED